MSEQPYYDDDENDFGDDASGFEFDDTDDDSTGEPSEGDESSDSAEVQNEAPSIIDLVANQQAAEVKQQIYQALYSKVGERLDAMKAETRQGAFDQTEE